MFTLDEIKKAAEAEAPTVEINWEVFDEPDEAEYFQKKLGLVKVIIPQLESLYEKLTSGKSVVFPDKEASLSYEDTEKYSEMVAEELYSAYLMQHVDERIRKVNDIIALSGSKE